MIIILYLNTVAAVWNVGMEMNYIVSNITEKRSILSHSDAVLCKRFKNLLEILNCNYIYSQWRTETNPRRGLRGFPGAKLPRNVFPH